MPKKRERDTRTRTLTKVRIKRWTGEYQNVGWTDSAVSAYTCITFSFPAFLFSWLLICCNYIHRCTEQEYDGKIV